MKDPVMCLNIDKNILISTTFCCKQTFLNPEIQYVVSLLKGLCRIHFQGRQFCLIVLSPFEKESDIKRKNVLPKGANSFLLEQTLFQKGVHMQESKRKVTKTPLLYKMLEKVQAESCPLSVLILVRAWHQFNLHHSLS